MIPTQIRQKIKVTYEDSIDNSPKDTKQGAAEDKVVSDFNLEKACAFSRNSFSVRHMNS